MREVTQTIKDGFHVARITIELIEQTKLRLIYIDEYGRNMRKLIPILARADVHQTARNVVNSMGLDEDLYQQANDDIDRLMRGDKH